MSMLRVMPHRVQGAFKVYVKVYVSYAKRRDTTDEFRF